MEGKKSTLCWECQRPGTGTCAWDASRGTVPVEGWTAELRPLLFGPDRYKDSYCVLECPLYIPDSKNRGAQDQRILTPEEVDQLNKLLLDGARTDFIARKLGISSSAVRKRRRKLFARMKKARQQHGG